MPTPMYSRIRCATVSGSPTRAVPAPPRTKPTPAHRLGLTSSLSRRPPWSAAIRLCPTESIRSNTFCAAEIVVSSRWADQFVGRAPSLFHGLANDDVQADAEGQIAASLERGSLDRGDLLGDLGGRLAPGEIFVH